MIRVKPALRRGNLKSVVAPALVVSQFLGLTFAYANQWKWLKIVYRLVIFTLLTLAFVNEIASIRYWILGSEGLHGTLVKFETSTRWGIFFGNYIIHMIHSNKIKAIVDDLNNSDIRLPEQVRKRAFRFNLLHLTFNILFIVVYDVMGHDFVWANLNYKSFTSSIYIFNDLIIMWSSFEYIQILNLIKECFGGVNERLRGYYWVSQDENVEDYIKGNEIIRLRQIHLSLCEICKRMNSCFSIQLLLIIFMSMIQVTYASRSLISDLIVYDIHETENLMDFIQNVLWCSIYFVMVVQMIAFSDITSFECKKGSLVVHHLINNHYQDKIVEKEKLWSFWFQLELFSIQIKQHEVIFTVWLFDLNFPLLNTIIATLTTYLVITITFQGEWSNGGLTGWDYVPPE